MYGIPQNPQDPGFRRKQISNSMPYISKHHLMFAQSSITKNRRTTSEKFFARDRTTQQKPKTTPLAFNGSNRSTAVVVLRGGISPSFQR
jgi:hypothetical protein